MSRHSKRTSGNMWTFWHAVPNKCQEAHMGLLMCESKLRAIGINALAQKGEKKLAKPPPVYSIASWDIPLHLQNQQWFYPFTPKLVLWHLKHFDSLITNTIFIQGHHVTEISIFKPSAVHAATIKHSIASSHQPIEARGQEIIWMCQLAHRSNGNSPRLSPRKSLNFILDPKNTLLSPLKYWGGPLMNWFVVTAKNDSRHPSCFEM